MPLYYLIGGSLQKVVGIIKGSSVLAFPFPPSNPNPDQYPGIFLHEPEESFFTLSEPAEVISIRLLSVMCGLVMVCGTYWLAGMIYPRRPWVKMIAATLVAGWPQFTYMSRAINNDALATAVAVLILTTLFTQVGRPYRYLAAITLSVVALLSKLSVLFTGVAVLSALLIEMYIFRNRWRAYLPVLISSLLIYALAFLLILHHPILGNHLRYGTTAPLALPGRVRQLSYWFEVFKVSLSSGWARFGWMNLPAPLWHAYLWWGLITLAGGIGIWQWHKAPHVSLAEGQIVPDSRPAATNRFCNPIYRWRWCFIAIWVAGIMISYIRVNLAVFQPQFRFAWPLLPLIAVFAGSGWFAIMKRQAKFAYFGLFFFLFLYNVWLTKTIIFGAYYGQ